MSNLENELNSLEMMATNWTNWAIGEIDMDNFDYSVNLVNDLFEKVNEYIAPHVLNIYKVKENDFSDERFNQFQNKIYSIVQRLENIIKNNYHQQEIEEHATKR